MIRWALAFIGSLLLASPAPCQEGQRILGPPWFEEAILYYCGFAGGTPESALQLEGITTSYLPPDGGTAALPGLIGEGILLGDSGARLAVLGEVISPHRPLTLSLWWALPQDLPIDGGFDLFGFTGKGYIGHFCRGKGEWCALERPAGVFQIYYFEGIQNVNGIYDFDLGRTLDLRAGTWHYSAVVFRPGGNVKVYTDGRLVFETTTLGRAFSVTDELTRLEIGGGIIADEVAVLGRAIDGDLLDEYRRGMLQLKNYHSQ